MATEWLWFLHVITTDKPKGNAVAALIDPDIGGGETFDKGFPLRLVGSQSVVPSAWAAHSPLKQPGLDYCVEFTGPGPYPLLAALGLTAEQIADFQSVLTIEYGPREQLEESLAAFIAASGYEIIPQE